jgi:hypothetical protein
MNISRANMPDEHANAQHPDHLLNSEVTFEVTDIRVGSIVGLGVALLVTLFVSMFVVWITFRIMDARQRADEPIISPLRVGMAPELPPEPRLQGEPGHPILGPQELRDVLSQARMQLGGSGWVNESAGITHIPIQQAMDELVQNGLPQVHTTAAAKPVVAASARGANKLSQPDSSPPAGKAAVPSNAAGAGVRP